MTADHFKIQQKSYSCQYSNIYFARLKTVKFESPNILIKAVQAGVPSQIKGVIYRHCTAKPNILYQTAAPVLENNVKFCNDADELSIEDETGRLLLAVRNNQ